MMKSNNKRIVLHIVDTCLYNVHNTLHKANLWSELYLHLLLRI